MARPKTTQASILAGAVCRIDSVVGVDERGQMVLPKSVRAAAGIRAGDKLALVTWEKDGEVCCLALLKAERVAEVVGGILRPMLRGVGQD